MNYILNQITYFAFFQSLLLIFILLVSKSKRQSFNIYVLILIITLLVGLLGKIGHTSLNWGRQLKGLSEFSILLFGPTIFLFIQSILSEKKISRSDIIHYIPAIIYSTIVTFYYILPSKEIISVRIRSGELYRVVHILIGIGLTVNIVYYIMSVLKYKELIKSLKNEISYEVNIQFVRNFLIAVGICLKTWLIVYLISFGNNSQIEIVSRQFIWIAIALIVLFIAYYQMVYPSVYIFRKISRRIKYTQSKFSHEELDILKLKLEAVMQKKKPFLNSELMKADLAELLSVNAPDLSRLLNERIGMNFFEYVNYYRIREFIKLAKSDKITHKTLFGLAQEAGFKSKSTFNKSFKQITGYPPSEFIKNMN